MGANPLQSNKPEFSVIFFVDDWVLLENELRRSSCVKKEEGTMPAFKFVEL